MPLDLQLDYDRGLPVYRQIYEAVLQSLASGRLEPAEQLPTIHELARTLGVNPNTVAHAYKELERDGHVVSARGRGTFPAARRPSTQNRAGVLKAIVDRALADAAGNGLTGEELVAYLRKALT